MQGESVERDLLTAAKAVEQQLVSAEGLAMAIAKWTELGRGSLLSHLDQLEETDENTRRELRALFAEYHDSLVGEIAESIDDSLFGKLNGALADIGDDGLQASVARWQTLSRNRVREAVSEDDRFEIVAAHARGGLGEVLVAKDRQLNRNVALKRIREKWAGNEYARVRFQQEAEITGRLEHPGVVPVYALGTRSDGEIFYAMRFVRGESMEETTARFHEGIANHPDGFQSPDFRDLLRRFIDVCNTIGYAHSRGIIHRDLKPANIMLGRYGETLVVDWGLAKQVGVEEDASYAGLESLIVSQSGSGSAPTQFGSAVGTPQYMSPEQATGRLDRMGPATDVFGLGATLYHVLTNQPPQPQDSVDRILDRVEHGDYEPANKLNERVPGPLNAICAKAMSMRSTERYADPQKMAADIESWLADEPTTVFQDPTYVRVARWTRKNQTLAAIAAMSMVLLIVASFAGSFAWNQFERQRFEYEQAEVRRQAKVHEQAEVRRTRLQASLTKANEIVKMQLADGQFELAVSVLNQEIANLGDEHEFSTERADLQIRAGQLSRIARFYQLSSVAEEANLLAQDEDEIIAVFEALEKLGVWQHADWWNALPDEDLNAEQRHQLRETVYRNLVLVASTYTKLTGIRTLSSFGSKIPDTLSGKLDAIFSQDGKAEARATLAICAMANRYRYSECLEWFHGIAGFRLLKAMMVPSHRLDEPRSPVDAFEIAILLLTSALREDFPFTRYRGVEDDLLHAREMLSTAARLSPNHYFTNLVLAQTEYLIGERAAENGDPEAWKHYELSQHAFGRCMAIDPDRPFAYGDVSTVCLREREVIAASKSLSAADIERNRADLLRRCIDFALQAVERAPNASWVYWHYGHALAAVDRVDDAMEAYRSAVTMTYSFAEDSNVKLIDVDRIRGRGRLIDETQKRIDSGDSRSVFHAIIAASYLITRDFDKARPYAEQAINIDPVDSLAWSTNGVIALNDGDVESAVEHFRKARVLRDNSFWATFGEAVCLEKQEQFQDAFALFQAAESLGIEKHHIADALLGQSRMQMQLGQSREAAVAAKKARAVYPACKLLEVERVALLAGDDIVAEAVDGLRHISTADIVANSDIVSTPNIFIQNHDFELTSSRSWHNPGAPDWYATGSGVSLATVKVEDDNRVLHVQTDPQGESIRATTRQSITVNHDTTYRLSVRAKWKNVEVGCLRVFVTEDEALPEEAVVEVPAGSSEWKTLSGTFSSRRLRRNKGLMPMTLWVVSEGKGDVWLDDFQIVEVPDAVEPAAENNEPREAL